MKTQLDHDSLRILETALARLEGGFSDLPPAVAGAAGSAGLEDVMVEVADRLRDNYPYFHPLYAGQMLKPPHPVARIAYALAMWINPNNHALEGGRASSRMEREAVAEIARMFGWTTCLGHLCGGGTMANLEALWISRCLRPDGVVLASRQAHYTHERIAGVLGLRFEAVECDRRGRLDVEALERRLERGGVGTVVATIGTTLAGAVDPLPDILALRERHGFRLHADAAYGGYFALVTDVARESRAAFERLGEADSIVVDPHKHGLQPYGCGCVLFRDPAVGRFYKHESPYSYFFSSTDLHLGEISLECSRPGAAAVALWATQRLLPLVPGGAFARRLASSRRAALTLATRLAADERFALPFAPELDIVVWAPRAGSAKRASELSRRVFDAAADLSLHLALAEVPPGFFDASEFAERDRPTITCLRSVLMKAEHAVWIDEIWTALDEATRRALATPPGG